MMSGTTQVENWDRGDPRRLRQMLERVALLALEQSVGSVVVGLAGREDDRLLREFMDFVESELRMEDSIFRLTRERAVLFLTDVERERAESIVSRLMESFASRFPARKAPDLQLGYFDVRPELRNLQLRDVLLAVFGVDS